MNDRRFLNKVKEIIRYETTPSGLLDNLISLIILFALWSGGIWVFDWQFYVILLGEGLRLGMKQYRIRIGDLPPWP